MINLGGLNPRQRLAVETIDGPVLILAGAGTGKTRVITYRIAHMIDCGIPRSQILAVTFTNKAAREMKERVAKLVPRLRNQAKTRMAPKRSSDTPATEKALSPLTPALSPGERENGSPLTDGVITLGRELSSPGDQPDSGDSTTPTQQASSELSVFPLPRGEGQGEGEGRLLTAMSVASNERDPEKSGPTISTFHSLGVRILRQHITKLGYKRNFVIYSESDQLGVVKRILSQISAKGEKIEPQEILAGISRCKSDIAAKPGTTSASAIARHILPRYESALRACNAIDFDDLLLLTLKLLREHPDVLTDCRDKFRYVMVDEYQDTNAAQFELVHLLTREHRNICVVGDDDQSIYGWRGAEIANLLDLEKHFPEVKVVKLEQNYRSTNVILQAANAVIKNNVRRRGKHLWSDKGEGERITLHTFNTDEDEARTIIEEIEFARMARRIPWNTQAILFRTNQQSRVLETALRKANVRYNLVGGQSFFDRREVKDFLAYLKTFVNPHDDISLLRIANVPARGLSDTTMERLLNASQERNCSVFTAMRHTDVQAMFQSNTRASLVDFLALIERVRSFDGQSSVSLTGWAERFLSEIGYLAELRRSEKNPETAENRIQNLKDLVASLDSAGDATDPPLERLQSFLEDVTLDSEREEEKELSADAVTLITMHSCKGLEFPHVYIVGLEDGLLPHSRSKEEGTLDEERRLFYVAITRAQQTLTLSCALGRKKYGQILPCHPSPFLKELPQELVEHADAKAKQPVTVDTGKGYFSALRASIGQA